MAVDCKSKLRFVIHHHIRSNESHWDLMLEKQDGEALMTWRVERGFDGEKAVRIFDHPIRFLDYEGAVENGSAKVEMVDKGQYSIFEEAEEKIGILLEGERVRGKFFLELQEGDKWSIREVV